MKNEQPELMNHTIIRQPSNYTNPDPAQSLSSMIALMRELSGILDSFHLSLKLRWKNQNDGSDGKSAENHTTTSSNERNSNHE